MNGTSEIQDETVRRVVLADDHAAVLEAITELLEPEFRVAGCVKESRALLDAVRHLKPDAVVTDINMPELDGVAAGESIVKSGLCDAVVILTVYNEAHMIRRALGAGIRGYVLKVDAGEELVTALHTVITGGDYLSRGTVRAADGVLLDDADVPGPGDSHRASI